MTANDPEDGFDQVMVQSWTNIAQQLHMLHQSFQADSDRLRNMRAQRREQRTREQQDRAVQRERLLAWQAENRERLNTGFEQVLDATVLAKGCQNMDDQHLLKTWVVAEQLEGEDPGYTPRLNEAKRRLRDEWDTRHPGQRIEAMADQLNNHVTVTYIQRSADLERTINAFGKAGLPVTPVLADDTEAFKRAHPDATFVVDTRLTGTWTGYDHDRIVDAVLQTPVSTMEDAGNRISFLKDQGLPESSHADNTAVGDEPSSVSETERSELADAAPMPAPVREPDAVTEQIPTVTVGQAPRSGKRSDAGREDGADSIASVDDPWAAIGEDGYATDDWDGPDMFGQFSPAMESTLAAQNAAGTSTEPTSGLASTATGRLPEFLRPPSAVPHSR